MTTAKQKHRMYRLHYNLKKKGNTVIARERMVFKRAKQLTDRENSWLGELLSFGYGIMDGIFTPPIAGDKFGDFCAKIENFNNEINLFTNKTE